MIFYLPYGGYTNRKKEKKIKLSVIAVMFCVEKTAFLGNKRRVAYAGLYFIRPLKIKNRTLLSVTNLMGQQI
jgi:hypothetical protein